MLGRVAGYKPTTYVNNMKEIMNFTHSELVMEE
jgi:hypothetical protein